MRLFQPTGDPLKDIPALTEWRDGLTFVELLRFLPYLKGALPFTIEDNDSLLMWDGVSQGCIAAVNKLIADGRIELKPTNPLTYVLDGYRSRMPVAVKKRKYKEQRWFPVTIVKSAVAKAETAETDRRIFALR